MAEKEGSVRENQESARREIARVASRLAPGSLRLRKDSFVDGALREQLSYLLYQVYQRDGVAFLKTVLTYLAAGAERLDEGMVKQAVQKVFTDSEGVTMATLAEKWMEQGFQRGMERAQEVTTRENVIEVLETRFGPLPAQVSRQLEEIHDITRLKQLLKAVTQAPELGSFLSKL